MNIVVLMAGNSEEFFKEGLKYPKYLFEVNGTPLVERVVKNLSSVASKFIFLINKEDAQRWHMDNVIKLLCPTAEVMVVEGSTKGAACSALYAIDSINNDEELLITNGDQILDINLKEFVTAIRTYDGGTVIFDSVHPRWSYVSLDSHGYIVQAEEKRPISRNATAGVYYFKKGKDFVAGASAMIKKDAHVNGNYYVCPVFNELILEQRKLGTFKIDRNQYHSLATVEGARAYDTYAKADK
ncbi:nucleotidyltransferase [Bdellovibrio sp. ZAP7]|uniref:glycosyltransferase family 2 protein n=1 Tax=Bdellovibrio sp. ZAP7 TaxID=2231053 RepID=UPI001159F8EB|nr:glycosyltransferase family 2 protein [Bdellovibrio sp. ZAP7]QDK45342.1 nucleotidyltransferase [Bdellovibrio sp. ZAP7]